MNYVKSKLKSLNTCIDVKTFESKKLYDSVPKYVREKLNKFDNIVNPFLDIRTSTRNILNIDSEKVDVSGNYNNFTCKIRIKNKDGILCYRYNYLGVEYILYTDNLKVMHRYKCPDNIISGEILYVNKDGKENLFRINKDIDDILLFDNLLDDAINRGLNINDSKGSKVLK